MSREQKESLYQLASWYLKDFNNEMVDTWTDINHRISHQCNNMIRTLEQEYILKYGNLPEWKSIDDVINIMCELKEDLYGR